MEFPWTKRLRRQNAELLDLVRQVLEQTSLGSASTSSRSSSAQELDEIRERLDRNDLELEGFGRRLDQYRDALADGIEHEERRERRIKASVQRARKQLAELGVQDESLEAEFDGLHLVDGSRSGEGGVHEVSEDVEGGARAQASSIKGVSAEQLRQVRGL